MYTFVLDLLAKSSSTCRKSLHWCTYYYCNVFTLHDAYWLLPTHSWVAGDYWTDSMCMCVVCSSREISAWNVALYRCRKYFTDIIIITLLRVARRERARARIGMTVLHYDIVVIIITAVLLRALCVLVHTPIAADVRRSVWKFNSCTVLCTVDRRRKDVRRKREKKTNSVGKPIHVSRRGSERGHIIYNARRRLYRSVFFIFHFTLFFRYRIYIIHVCVIYTYVYNSSLRKVVSINSVLYTHMLVYGCTCAFRRYS